VSWIFGYWHPGDTSGEQLVRWIDEALPGAVMHRVARSPLFLGAGIEHLGTSAGVVASDGSVTLADARLDAIGDNDLGSISGDQAASFLVDLLTGDRASLDDLAGDFAAATFDPGMDRLLLTRDACGSRPLYWKRVGEGVAFGSSPRFLLAMTPNAWRLDIPTCAAALAGLELPPSATGVDGVHTVPGGHLIEFTPAGIRRRRWFRPELDPVADRIDDDAIGTVGVAIRASVRARSTQGQVGLLLSGGRDSGSLAAALAAESIVADCYTMTFDPTICASEDGPARSLADGLGHRWAPLPQSPEVIVDDQGWLARLAPMPTGYPFGTSLRHGLAAIVERGSRVVFEGIGGELFVASPHATLDLARRGRFSVAARSARAFKHRWVYGYRRQAKIAAMSIAPERLRRLRRQHASRPPWAAAWLPPGPSAVSYVGSARAYRLRFLRAQGVQEDLGRHDLVSYPSGYRSSFPFFDRRVIRAALNLPAEALVPDPSPKWVLERALLGEWAGSRVKGSQEGWFRLVARNARRAMPSAYGPDSSLAALGVVEPGWSSHTVIDPRWEVQSATLAWMETVAMQYEAQRMAAKEPETRDR
jgi:asparagine synthetase B (glutamine-hydrolysing)